MSRKQETILSKVFKQIVTKEIEAQADYCGFNDYLMEDEKGFISTDLRIGSEKIWLMIYYYDEKGRHDLGWLEYWAINEETIETASKAVCQITKNLLKVWYN